MPSSVAILTGLTYKGTDLQDFPRVFFRITEGGPDMSPEVRGLDTTTPYRTGRTYGPKRLDRLPIGLTGWVSGEGSTEAQHRSDTAQARQEMAALFDVVGGVGTLSVTTEDGTVWTVSAYPEAFVPQSEPDVDAPAHWTCSVRLIAIDPPYWVSAGS